MQFKKNKKKRLCVTADLKDKIKRETFCFDDSGGCRFPHELNSEHNRRILREHELDDLSRKELCTLLMQSDDQMLPPVRMNMLRWSRAPGPKSPFLFSNGIFLLSRADSRRYATITTTAQGCSDGARVVMVAGGCTSARGS